MLRDLAHEKKLLNNGNGGNYLLVVVVTTTINLYFVVMTTKMKELIEQGGFPNPKEKLGYLFWQINMQWVRRVNQLVSEFDMTHTQLITLIATKWLSTKQDEVIQQDVVETIKIDRMLVSKMVKKNVAAGLMIKKSSEKDSRVNVLKITKGGQDKIVQVLPVMLKAEQEFYGALGKDRENVTLHLQHLLENIDQFMNQSNKN